MPRANPMRGEAELGEHKLVVNFNGWCIAEAATGRKMNELLRESASDDGLGMGTLRAMVRAFLEKDMTYEETGDLIDSIGLEETLLALSKAMGGFFSDAAEDKKENPLKAA